MNQLLEDALAYGRETGCSDLHLDENALAMLRKDGVLCEYPIRFTDGQIKDMIISMLNEKQLERLQHGEDLDFCYVDQHGGRQRVNVYRQQGKLAAALRIINDRIRTLDELQMPEVLKKLAMEPRGLVLVTGPTGSGKSTTLAAIMDYVNTHRKCHILTLEDPVEYVYQRKCALIHQREIGNDVASFDTALKSAMREDPDVILVGEMRDYETIAAVITLAETGHLVFSTLHTIGAAKTIDRIIDVFPSDKQDQIRMQVSGVLKAVITQQLLPCVDEGRVAALEILICTDAVSSLIRDQKVHQINSILQTGAKEGMQSLNLALANLIRKQRIHITSAQKFSDDPQELMAYL